MFETIAELKDPAVAGVLIAALQAHGFHPREGGESGLPGLPGVFAPRGIPIELPAEEAADGKLLADELVKDMLAR